MNIEYENNDVLNAEKDDNIQSYLSIFTILYSGFLIPLR